MRLIINILCINIFFAFSLISAEEGGQPLYKTGFAAVVKIGTEIQKVIDEKYKNVVNEIPVFLETDLMPSIKPVEYPGPNGPMRAVFISAGFIDLVNLVAHAKAIDSVQKGYFENYVLLLSKETGAKELSPLPDGNDKKFQTDDILNSQRSYFNQMVAMVLAIELSHHYLGHFKKYASKLEDSSGKQVPINDLLTPDEWNDSLKEGTRVALNCGFGIDGIKALYDAIAKMKQRPAWTSYFLPRTAKVDKIKKDLEKMEKKFFSGDL
jgi:hypothetical protein